MSALNDFIVTLLDLLLIVISVPLVWLYARRLNKSLQARRYFDFAGEFIWAAGIPYLLVALIRELNDGRELLPGEITLWLEALRPYDMKILGWATAASSLLFALQLLLEPGADKGDRGDRGSKGGSDKNDEPTDDSDDSDGELIPITVSAKPEHSVTTTVCWQADPFS
jgi:hypothetical protein